VVFSGRREDYTRQFQLFVEAASRKASLRALSLAGTGSLPIFSSYRKMEEVLNSDGSLARPGLHGFLCYAVQWETAERWHWNAPQSGLATGLSAMEIHQRRAVRNQLKAAHPRIFLPLDGRWWLRDAMGTVFPSLPGSLRGRLDFSSPDFVERPALRAKTLIDTGCVDGIYLANWDEEAV
jgi:hypothetical protein